jgi:hypothetical protein
MGVLEEIQGKILQRRYEFSKHAVDQSIIRDISVAEVEEAVSGRCEIIEDYPDDKYGPELPYFGVYEGWTAVPSSVQLPSRQLIKIITLYEPDPDLWVDFRVRKK